jgi:hypothetical protein
MSTIESKSLDVFIRRQWNDFRIAKVSRENIRDLRWDFISGGMRSRAPQPFIHAYVWCDQVEGDIAHSCMHGRGPHRIKVCVTKKDNDRNVWRVLLEAAGPKPDR